MDEGLPNELSKLVTVDTLAELEERFLKVDEKLDELPNPEKPDDEKEETELDHLLDILASSIATAHSSLAFLNRPRYQGNLKELLNDDAMGMLKALEVSLADALKLLDPDEFDDQDEYEKPLDDTDDEADDSEDSEDEPEDATESDDEAEVPDEKEKEEEDGEEDQD